MSTPPQNLADGPEVAVGEDETDVAVAHLLEGVRQQARVLLAAFLDALSGIMVFFPHEDLVLSAESDAGLLERVGPDVTFVYLNDEALGGVRRQELLHPLEVLPPSCARPREA
eukprot:CAMPEP_0113553310 /NCGR_PEP_ID=MMETSP0015_2-20120614/15544_1 /TAXON_ID=2838 /ORGANISM="Odontella" /LENGTH=112 /DNA_ID=CAMNT_0000454369 /DNA_START=109 /DNA_END=448 /DNA_ORIENTATION=+ /assembly_acc=CAM_ASM_000160